MKHESCGTAEKVWLPYEVDGRSRGLKPQSYCVHCGAVEKISSKSKNKNKKAKRMGYYTSILPRLGITKVQIRHCPQTTKMLLLYPLSLYCVF